MPARESRTAPARVPAGFTLIEVLLSTVLVGVALTSVGWLMSQAARTQAMHAERGVDEVLLAREVYELAQLLERTPAGTGAAKTAGEVLALDNLDGARFSPPIQADMSAVSGASGWAQVVQLDVFDVDDLSTPVSSTMPSSIAKGDESVYRLTVSIQEGSTTRGTYQWWLKP